MDAEKKAEYGNYSFELHIFERLIGIGIAISDSSGGIYTTNLGIEGTRVYTRLVLSGMTICLILPHNKFNKHKGWDLSSLATLSRTFIETCHRHLYLTEDALSENEIEFRLDLYNYRLNSEKYKFYKEMGADESVLRDFEENLPKKRDKIVASPVYLGLSKEMSNTVRSGNADMYFTDEEIANRFQMIDGKFKPFYRLLSNHSHGSPFATASQSNERGRGFENDAERFYFTLILQILSHYFSRIIIAQVNLLNLSQVSPNGLLFAQLVFTGQHDKKS